MDALSPMVETGYEVQLPIFEGPLDLLLYLVQKNELDPRQIQISAITDQYLKHLDSIGVMNLSNAGEFLVMAARLMRLKARELLPNDQKDELEELEYELDRQALIQQMLEYQKFKEAARSLRGFEARNFGAYGRGRLEKYDAENTELDGEAGIYDLLMAFRSVVVRRPKPPVHEVEIDDVTIEDRMQEVETRLMGYGRVLFEDFFETDPRRITKVVTFMAILELCKTDQIVLRQAGTFAAIWAYRKNENPDYALEMGMKEIEIEEVLPAFAPGLYEWVRAQMERRTVQSALDVVMEEIERELKEGGGSAIGKEEMAKLVAAASDAGSPDELAAGLDEEG